MNQEIDKIIDLIDQKIKALQQAKKILIEEFGVKRSEDILTLPGLTVQKSFAPHGMTSKQRIAKLLKEEGAQTRRDIITKTGIKVGTISFALNDGKLFYKKEGKWYLKEE